MSSALRGYIRDDLAGDADSLPDDLLDRNYDRMATPYAGNDDAIYAATRLLTARQIVIQAAKLTDYRQGESEEKLSQMAKALEPRLKEFEAELEDAVTAGSDAGGVMWGGLRRKPTRLKEYPDA